MNPTADYLELVAAGLRKLGDMTTSRVVDVAGLRALAGVMTKAAARLLQTADAIEKAAKAEKETVN